MSGEGTGALGRASLFACQISADQEEPWRRFLQELSGSRFEEYAPRCARGYTMTARSVVPVTGATARLGGAVADHPLSAGWVTTRRRSD